MRFDDSYLNGCVNRQDYRGSKCPEWPMFERSVWQIFLNRSTRNLATFWAILKTSIFITNYFLGNFCKILGYFLFSHLVTLTGTLITVVYILDTLKSASLNVDNFDGVLSFTFPETAFTTVTAYQNQQVSHGAL